MRGIVERMQAKEALPPSLFHSPLNFYPIQTRTHGRPCLCSAHILGKVQLTVPKGGSALLGGEWVAELGRPPTLFMGQGTL